jgi:ankyrin repeat protein
VGRQFHQEFRSDLDASKAGANVKAKDSTDFTVLLIAAEYNTNLEVLTRLIRAGADLNAKYQDGYTPLIEAASKNMNPAVIMTLLGADAKAKKKKGYTALDYAKSSSADGP